MDTKKLSEYSIILGGLVLMVFILIEFQSFLRPLIIALLLSFLFTPLLRFSKKKLFIQIFKIIGVLLVLVLVFGLIGNIASKNISSFTETFISESNLISNYSMNVFGKEISISKTLDSANIQTAANNGIKSIASSLGVFISEFFLVILFLIFIIPLHNSFMKRTSKRVEKIIFEMEKGIREYLKVKTMISLGTAATSLIIMLLFGVENAFLFAVLIFMFNYIPSIGSFVTMALILISELFMSGFGINLIILAFFLIMTEIIFGNFIEPKISGKNLGLSPLTIIISLFFWGAIWGIGGMLFSIPLTLAIKTCLKNYKEYKDIDTFLS